MQDTQTNPLAGMTWERWQSLPKAEQERIRDLSDLSPQLVGLEGQRVEVVTEYGLKRRFYVGRSTGWRPIHLEIHNSRSVGGQAAFKRYQSVRVVPMPKPRRR